MKVALVSSYCLDSTMPLAKHLADNNVAVHLFGIMPKYNQNLYVVDFSKNMQPSGFVSSETSKKQMGGNLCKYLFNVETFFFGYPAGAGKKAFFGDIFYAWRLSRHLIKDKFDIIHLIHTSNRFSLLVMYFLKKQNLVQTLHEVTGHGGDTSSYNIKILKLLIERSIPIIFNSQISKDRFLQFRASVSESKYDANLYKMIRFSLYETYDCFSSGNQSESLVKRSVPIILHFGNIVPYKGIDILIDAVKIVQKNRPVHLVVAGKGTPYFNFDGIENYEFINKSISNEMIIDLIKKCTMVVCPYTSASQSGIPMTVFLFNKAIIASKVGGFQEIIENDKTGILVDKIDASSFADAIEYFISKEELAEEMAINIENKFKSGEFSWFNIAKETISFYRNYLKTL